MMERLLQQWGSRSWDQWDQSDHFVQGLWLFCGWVWISEIYPMVPNFLLSFYHKSFCSWFHVELDIWKGFTIYPSFRSFINEDQQVWGSQHVLHPHLLWMKISRCGLHNMSFIHIPYEWRSHPLWMKISRCGTHNMSFIYIPYEWKSAGVVNWRQRHTSTFSLSAVFWSQCLEKILRFSDTQSYVFSSSATFSRLQLSYLLPKMNELICPHTVVLEHWQSPL